ncbi:MAG: hypothetical protein LBI99_02025, partial [Propionibacteriaceae bacterium]|nr:hypothetical protein [Propionibacteriaceae bacterium]
MRKQLRKALLAALAFGLVLGGLSAAPMTASADDPLDTGGQTTTAPAGGAGTPADNAGVPAGGAGTPADGGTPLPVDADDAEKVDPPDQAAPAEELPPVDVGGTAEIADSLPGMPARRSEE